MPNKGLELYCVDKPEWQTVEIFDQKEETVPHIMLAMVHDISRDERLLHIELTAILRIMTTRLADPCLENHIVIPVCSMIASSF